MMYAPRRQIEKAGDRILSSVCATWHEGEGEGK